MSHIYKYSKYKAKYLAAQKDGAELTGTMADLNEWRFQEGASASVKSLVYESQYEAKAFPNFFAAMGADPEVKRVKEDGNEYLVRKLVVKDGPVKYYEYICSKYGKPTYVANKKGGICKWIDGQTEKSIFPHEEIVLVDEYVRHEKPGVHFDFVYSVIKVYIPPEKLVDVLRISGSINYDPLLKHLRARCGGFSANFATFKSVLDVLESGATDYGKNITDKEQLMHYNEMATMYLVNTNQPTYRIQLACDSYPIEKIGT